MDWSYSYSMAVYMAMTPNQMASLAWGILFVGMAVFINWKAVVVMMVLGVGALFILAAFGISPIRFWNILSY